MFTVVVADNVSVKTITVSGAIPFIGNPPIDPPIDGPGDDIIIDENKINEDAIQLSPDDTTSGTQNTFYFVKTYQYSEYNFGSNSDNVVATVTDLNDNISTSNLTINFTKVDTQAPSISSFSTNTSTLTWFSSDSDSSDKIATLTAQVSDNRGIDSVSVNGATQTNVSGNTYTFTKSFSRPTLNNSTNNTLTLTVQDAAGNSSTDNLTITTIHTDNTPPVISLFSVDDNTVMLNSSDSTSQTVGFSAIVSDNVSISSVTISPLVSLVSSIGGNYSWNKLFDADHFSFGTTSQTYTLTVRDHNGYTSTDTQTITITKADSTGPSISSFIASSTNFTLLSTSQTKTVTFTVVVADNVAVKTITVSGATPIPDVPSDDDDEIIIDDNRINEQIIQLEPTDTTPGTSNTFRFSKVYRYVDYTYGSGSDNVICTVTDMNDNSSTANLTINITKTDNQGPIISSFSADDTIINLTTEGSTSAQSVIFTAFVTDNVAISSVALPNTNLVGSSGNTYTYSKLFDSDNYCFLL